MEPQPIGIDIGYRALKCVHSGGEKFIIPTVIGTPDTARMRVGGSTDILLEFDEYRFLIGESANTQSRMIMRREDRHWYSSPEYRAMFYTALAKIQQRERANAHIVTGLPVEYFDDKDHMIEALEGRHEFHYNGTPMIANVNEVVVILQPFGTLLDQVFSAPGGYDTEIAEGKIGIIDIGGKTTNFLTAIRLQELRKQSTSISKGGWDIVRAVKAIIADEFPGLSQMSDHDVSQAIANRTIKSFGNPVDIGEIVDRVVKPFAEDIIASTTPLWNSTGEMIDRIFVTGGGAFLIFAEIAAHFPHAKRVTDPVFANASGYWRFMKYLLES